MVILRSIKLCALMLCGLILASQSHAMQKYGAYKNQSYVYTPEQLTITIEPYQHERDYTDLYHLFIQNKKNLGSWGYDDTFPLGSQIKVARWFDQLAGFVIYMQQENQGYINYVAVDQQIRSNGLGKILLCDAIDDLKQQGADSVSLNVYEHNTKAQSLYERLGFYLQSAHHGLMNYTLNLA